MSTFDFSREFHGEQRMLRIEKEPVGDFFRGQNDWARHDGTVYHVVRYEQIDFSSIADLAASQI